MKFVNASHHNAPTLESVGKVEYVVFTKGKEPISTNEYAFFIYPNGARVTIYKGPFNIDRCMVALGSSIEEAWGKCVARDELMKQFGAHV